MHEMTVFLSCSTPQNHVAQRPPPLTVDPISTRVMYIVPRSHTNTAQWGEPENKLNYAMFKVHGNSQAASLVVNGLAV